MSGRWRRTSSGTEWYWRAKTMGGDRAAKGLGWFEDSSAGRMALRAEVQRRIEAGELAASRPAAAPRSERPRTVAELLNLWLPTQEARIWSGPARARPKLKKRGTGPLSQLTYAKYKYACEHLVAWMGALQLNALTEQDFVDYIANRRFNEAEPKDRARNNKGPAWDVDKVLGAAWRWARKRGWVGEMPSVPDASDEPAVYNNRTPSMDDVLAILPHLDEVYALAVTLLVWSGARVGELTKNVLISDVDLHQDGGVIRLFGKGGKWRTLTIPAERYEWVARRVEEGDPNEPLLRAPERHLRLRRRKYLDATEQVPNTGILQQTVNQMLWRACDAAEVKRFSCHGLRRLAEDMLAESGSEPGTNSKLLGHSEEVALKNYRTVRVSGMRKAQRAAGLGAVFHGGREVEGNVIGFPGAGGGDGDARTITLAEATLEQLLEEVARRQAGIDHNITDGVR